MDKTIKLTLIFSLLFSVLALAEEEVKIPPILLQQVEQGDAQSAYLIGMMFLNGEGAVKVDQQQAKKWLQKAAAMNQPHAMFELAMLLYQEQQFEQAKSWFEKAAEQGHGEAYYYLSFYPIYHQKTPQCKPAYKLLEQAQSRGVDDAFNDQAWLLATLPDNNCRNGEKAWRIFAKLDQSFGVRAAMPLSYIDTKAAVLAEISEFTEAIDLQRQVVYLGCEFEAEQELQNKVEKWLKKHTADEYFCYNAMQRLQYYLQRKPWRETPINNQLTGQDKDNKDRQEQSDD